MTPTTGFLREDEEFEVKTEEFEVKTEEFEVKTNGAERLRCWCRPSLLLDHPGVFVPGGPFG